MRYIASVSFGKDSLAMLLRLIDEKKPLDEVIFYDTGMEFQAIYNIRDKVKSLLLEKDIKYTELKPNYDFEYKMFEKPVKERKPPHNIHYGYSWCGGRCRWGTSDKLQAIDKYCNDSIVYVGIAVDEPERLKKERKPNKCFPLADWKMTEKDCLEYCYKKGWNWDENGIELYSILDRVSCYCCANKNLKELKNYYKQQTIDHIIQNGKYYDVISISKARVKKIVENGLKYEQLKKENKDLKSSQNKVAIEKLEELFDILNENITDFTDVGKSKYCWLCIEEFNKNFNSIIAELKG